MGNSTEPAPDGAADKAGSMMMNKRAMKIEHIKVVRMNFMGNALRLYYSEKYKLRI
jgi:hypothetical protein